MKNTVLHHIIYGSIAYFALAVVVAFDILPIPLEQYNLSIPLCKAIGMGIFYVACANIVTYKHLKTLRGENRFLWQKRNIYPYLGVLFVLCVVNYVFFQNYDLSSIFIVDIPQGMTADVFAERKTTASRNLVALLLGSFMFWICFLHILIKGSKRGYISQLMGFVQKYVWIFMIYRLAMFVCSVLGSLIMGYGNGGIQNSYFMFVMGDEMVQALASGLTLSGGDILTGLTTTSSIYILGVLAEEYISGTGENSLSGCVRRLLLDLDTVKLLIMSVTCIFFTIMSGDSEKSVFEFLIISILILFWLASTLLFLADTNIVDYLINFAMYGLIERLIMIPESSGLVLALLVVCLRIILFAAAAVLLAIYRLNGLEQIRNQQTKKGINLPGRILNATFLDAILFLDRSYSGFNKKNGPTEMEEDAQFLVEAARKVDDYILKLLKPFHKN